MGIQLERVAPNYANIVSLDPNQVISDDFDYEQIAQVGNSVSIVHVGETEEPIVMDDGNSRPYENVVSSQPYANLDLSQCHTAAGVVNETYEAQPLNSNNSVSIVHVGETVEPIVMDDGNSRPYENVVSSHPYANLDLSQCHTAAGVVNETYAATTTQF